MQAQPLLLLVTVGAQDVKLWSRSEDGPRIEGIFGEGLRAKHQAPLERGDELAPNMLEFLEIWKWTDRQFEDYPTVDGEIYKFHTELRKHHSRARRSAGAADDPSPVLDRINPDFTGQGGDR